MKQFELTPAMQWLEETYLQRRPFDDNTKRDIFELVMDHQCLPIDPITLELPECEIEGCSCQDVDPDRCFWASRDEDDQHYFPDITIEQWDDRIPGDPEFDYTLSMSAQSPIYNAIGLPAN